MSKTLLAAAVAATLALAANAASAANFVTNAGFDTASAGGSTSASYFQSGGESAADDWLLWNNTFGTTATNLAASTDPNGGGSMLHVTTDGTNNGIYQVFAGFARYAQVDLNIVSGFVTLYLYSSTQNGAITLGATNGWQTLTLDAGSAISNEIVIYSNPGGADFYVDNAYASDLAPPPGISSAAPEPGAWALMLAGFGLGGAALRRRRAALA